ncbi:hypothetical protein A2U01_0109943, partial [Trifolium medium]|nr:hypothetical protein [Trifolium medium]MCI88656.1 hypothetical protein [Trifolium medium]
MASLVVVLRVRKKLG